MTTPNLSELTYKERTMLVLASLGFYSEDPGHLLFNKRQTRNERRGCHGWTIRLWDNPPGWKLLRPISVGSFGEAGTAYRLTDAGRELAVQIPPRERYEAICRLRRIGYWIEGDNDHDNS